MITAFNYRNAFVSSSAVILLFSALLILLAPPPSFADRIVTVRQYTTLAVGCDLSSGDEFIGTTKILTYNQPTKLTFNCERLGGDIDLKKGESVSLRCLHDNPLTIPKHVKMKTGELFYILCNVKHNSAY
jgi:hypothetical protein